MQTKVRNSISDERRKQQWKIGALEALYETLTQAPCEEREALLWESARGEEGLRML